MATTYNYGDALPADASPTSQAYINNAQAGYTASRQAPRQQAMQDLQGEYTSRGMQNSGLAGFGQMSMKQGFENEDAQNRQQLGMQAANVGEHQREMQQQRDWQVQDRNIRTQQLQDEIARQQQQQQAQQWGQIANGVGSVVGGAVGTYYGGPAGAGVGSQAGGGVADALSGYNPKLGYGSYGSPGQPDYASQLSGNPYGVSLQ